MFNIRIKGSPYLSGVQDLRVEGDRVGRDTRRSLGFMSYFARKSKMGGGGYAGLGKGTQKDTEPPVNGVSRDCYMEDICALSY